MTGAGPCVAFGLYIRAGSIPAAPFTWMSVTSATGCFAGTPICCATAAAASPGVGCARACATVRSVIGLAPEAW